jgi:hypothetical protein
VLRDTGDRDDVPGDGSEFASERERKKDRKKNEYSERQGGGE